MGRSRLPAILCAAAIAFAHAACADARADSPWSDWSVLRLDAKMGGLGSGRVEMRLRDGDRGAVLETEAAARMVGMRVGRSRTTSVLGADGRSERHERYSRDRGRRILFHDDGYEIEKLRSAHGFTAPPEDWKVYFRERYAYPAPDGRAVRPFDYYGMLLHLRDADLERPGDRVELWVATSDGPQLYRVEVAESRTHDRTWLDLGTGKERTEELRELRLDVTPADPANAEEGFLRMQGQTVIWVEAESKTPVEISGRVPRVGQVRMHVRAMK
jgi:hypothetical protein